MINYIWLIIFIIALTIEFLTPTALVTIWFAIASLFAYVAQILHFSLTIQILLFIVISLLTLFLLRPIFISYLKTNMIATNSDRAIGKQAILRKEIKDEEFGEVKINGIIWNAVSLSHTSIKQGELVEVIAIDGSKLIVKKIGG